MSRRLTGLSEQALEEGGRGAQKAVEEAGFDEELKQKLLNRIADASFKSDNASAFAQAKLPSSAGRGTRDIAGAAAWTGTESLEDATLRMLNDSAPKPIRVPFKAPIPRGIPIEVKTGQRKAGQPGSRLANARDRVSSYAYLKDPNLDEEERKKFQQELKERFTSGASRNMPATLRGLQSLANERIENAIARGQFKNLEGRGKKIERDYNMSSPFLDTTEYFMNKIIQRQDIVPPWIEKQQELVSTATKFRGRLRNDWKRYAARMIASQGGSVDSQIRKAEHYAQAEAIVNPTKKKVETINTVDKKGEVSQVTLASKPVTPTSGETEDVQENITITESAPVAVEAPASPPFPPAAATSTTLAPPAEITDQIKVSISAAPAEETTADTSSNPYIQSGYIKPFRDRTWEANEAAYHKLAIENLNSLTRSYNLMAPKIAQKPYFFLDRELLACYAEVAPQLAGEIAERARAPPLKARIEVVRHKPGGIMEKFGGEHASVYDEVRPQYGFKEMWRDLFAKKQT